MTSRSLPQARAQVPPDISKEPDAELRMQEVNEANAVLSDPEKRAAYDQLGRGYQPGQDFRHRQTGRRFRVHRPGYSPREAADFSDFFAELFGRMGGAHAGARSTHAGFRAQGEDHHAKVLLDWRMPSACRPQIACGCRR